MQMQKLCKTSGTCSWPCVGPSRFDSINFFFSNDLAVIPIKKNTMGVLRSGGEWSSDSETTGPFRRLICMRYPKSWKKISMHFWIHIFILSWFLFLLCLVGISRNVVEVWRDFHKREIKRGYKPENDGFV